MNNSNFLFIQQDFAQVDIDNLDRPDLMSSGCATSIAGIMLKGMRKRQEDSFWIGSDFCVLSDGMGGQPDGNLASSVAVSAAASVMSSLVGADDINNVDIADRVRAAITAADEAIGALIDMVIVDVDGSESHAWPYGRSMYNWPAATMIIVATGHDAQGQRIVIGHIGDSRAFVFNRSTRALHQLTNDHVAWGGSVGRWIGGQGMQPDIIEIRPELDVTTFPDGWVAPLVDVDGAHVDLRDVPFDIIVASDGLFQRMSNESIRDVLDINADASPLVKTTVLSRAAEQSQSSDNITVAVMQFD